MSADPDDIFTLDMIAPAAPRVEMSEAEKAPAKVADAKPATGYVQGSPPGPHGPERQAARAEARARPHISTRPRRAAAAARLRAKLDLARDRLGEC